MFGLSRRNPAIELDDLERAARVTLLRLGERRRAGAGGEGACGTRVTLRMNPASLAAIGLPRSLVAGDLRRSLDQWAAQELPSRTPVDVELVPDRSLAPRDVRVWFGDGRQRPTAAAEVDEGSEELGAVGPVDERESDDALDEEIAGGDAGTGAPRDRKSGRIGAARPERAHRRGYSVLSVLAPRSNARRVRRRRLAVMLAVLVAALCWYLVGPAMADTYAAPGPAPDVVLLDGSPATSEGGWGSTLPWIGIVVLTVVALAGLGMLALAGLKVLARRRRTRAPSPAIFPATVAHRIVGEGIRERADAQDDASAILADLRRVRDVAEAEGWEGATADAMAIERDLQWVRQKLAFAPAGRLAASRGAAVDTRAVIDADQGVAGALQSLGEQIQALRQRARRLGGSSVVQELAGLRQTAGDLRGMVARRPALIID